MTQAIVFTHFTPPHEAQPIEHPANQATISTCCHERIRTYADCPSVGLVYVFIAEGYQAILGDSRPWEGLERERILEALLQEAIRKEDPTGKIQIVGTRELTPTMAALSRAAGDSGNDRLGNLLLGRGKYMCYDSPKVVEAIIRLARAEEFGKEPILRFDADVAVDETNVRRLLNHYLEHCAEDYYFFSGGYRSPNPTDSKCELLNKCAVRVAQFCGEGGGADTLDEVKAEQFLKDLPGVGADPNEQVISGAGLCMSPRAIRELPPFANVGDQIIWIDDHLKRVLHEDLGHFGYPKDAHCRCDQVTFVQDRYPPPEGVTADAVRWHSDDYLRRLVRGCLLDAMIQDRSPTGQGFAAHHVDVYKRKRVKLSKAALETKLQKPAKKRLDEIRRTWRGQTYRRSAVASFARRNLSGDSATSLVGEAIAAVNTYFELLKVWHQFVVLCAGVHSADEANRWLFRPV